MRRHTQSDEAVFSSLKRTVPAFSGMPLLLRSSKYYTIDDWILHLALILWVCLWVVIFIVVLVC